MTDAPPQRRNGWRLLGLIVLGMVLLTIGGGFWWYYDDSDLVHIRAKARDQGQPLAWNDLGLTKSATERLEQWRRVTELVKRLDAFQNKAGPDGKFFQVWDPISEALLAHHAAIDAATIADLVAALDHLGDEPLVLHDELSYSRLMPEIGVSRLLIRFMQERLILAEPHETGAWARRMLATCRRFSVDSLISHLVRNSLLDATLRGIAFRLGDLKQHDPAIADDILATLQPHHDNLLRAFGGEFVAMLGAVSTPGKFQIQGPGWNDQWYTPLITRAGRHGALDTYLDAVTRLRQEKPDTMLAWANAMDARIDAARGGIPYPSLILSGLFMPSFGVVMRQGETTLLHGRLLAAELRGTSWPVDVFDPKGSPLRPLMRDGRVIAGYTVHTDGVDDGGHPKSDRVFPLYAKP